MWCVGLEHHYKPNIKMTITNLKYKDVLLYKTYFCKFNIINLYLFQI